MQWQDRQTNMQKQTYTQIYIGNQTDWHTKMQINKQKCSDREIDRQADRKTEKDIEIDRQIDR
jgi:hypothetical protein